MEGTYRGSVETLQRRCASLEEEVARMRNVIDPPPLRAAWIASGMCAVAAAGGLVALGVHPQALYVIAPIAEIAFVASKILGTLAVHRAAGRDFTYTMFETC